MNENNVVKALRVCTSERTISKCSKICPYHNVQDCRTKLMIDAADAIEELLQKEKFHAFLWNVINPNDMQLYLEMYHSGNEKENAG